MPGTQFIHRPLQRLSRLAKHYVDEVIIGPVDLVDLFDPKILARKKNRLGLFPIHGKRTDRGAAPVPPCRQLVDHRTVIEQPHLVILPGQAGRKLGNDIGILCERRKVAIDQHIAYRDPS
ncbi:hypothetical protein D3C78_1605930 [compost metagenome]